jgi:hypothetical protein
LEISAPSWIFEQWIVLLASKDGFFGSSDSSSLIVLLTGSLIGLIDLVRLF